MPMLDPLEDLTPEDKKIMQDYYDLQDRLQEKQADQFEKEEEEQTIRQAKRIIDAFKKVLADPGLRQQLKDLFDISRDAVKDGK